jgi:hypothetical protein
MRLLHRNIIFASWAIKTEKNWEKRANRAITPYSAGEQLVNSGKMHDGQ